MPGLAVRVTIVLFCLVGAVSASAFRAGAFAADITPRQWPVRLIGGFAQPLVEKAHDALHARAVVLDDGRSKLALVIVDSCYLPRALYERAKLRAHRATGIPVANMLMAATHTHSAPPSKPEGASEVELAYQRLLEEQIAAAVVEAHKRLRPAEIGWVVRDEPDELFNRRWYLKPGTMPVNPFGSTEDKVKMNPARGGDSLVKPAGPVDPGFTVISVRAAGKPVALIGNYSLHYVGGVAAGGVSADYFGEFARQIADRLDAGPDFVGMLANGTSGDVNNINFRGGNEPRRQPFEKIRLVAGKLADSAMRAYAETKFQKRVRVGAVVREHPVKFRKPTPDQLDWARRTLAEPDEKKLPQNAKAYAGRVIRLHEGPEVADVLLQAARLGELGFTAIPCEVFTETGLELKAKSPFKTTANFELANGHYGYLPTPEQHELGGYETWMGTNLLEKNASRGITDALLQMLRDLRR